MKVILQSDIKNIGEKGDIVDVKKGYGRNYLIPRGLAVEATPGNIRRAAHQRKVESDRAKRQLKEAEAIGEKIKGRQIKLAARVGEGGKLFGSITAQEIADELRRQFSVEIDKRKIDLKEPIKNLGAYTATVKIHPEIHVAVEVIVAAD